MYEKIENFMLWCSQHEWINRTNMSLFAIVFILATTLGFVATAEEQRDPTTSYGTIVDDWHGSTGIAYREFIECYDEDLVNTILEHGAGQLFEFQKTLANATAFGECSLVTTGFGGYVVYLDTKFDADPIVTGMGERVEAWWAKTEGGWKVLVLVWPDLDRTKVGLTH